MESLEQYLLDSKPAIESWFQLESIGKSLPIYSSVDIRNAGYKLTQVDTNLFPGGWNNMTAHMASRAVQALQQVLKKMTPFPKRVLIVPENHTRNLFYLSNVSCLQDFCRMAGVDVRVGSLNTDSKQSTEIVLPNGKSLVLEPLVRNGDSLGLVDFDPCLVLLNTDLSGGVPPTLAMLNQPILPPVHAGWHIRRKHDHFQKFTEVCDRFGQWLGLDPWLINPFFSHCEGIDFVEGAGLEALQAQVDVMLKRIRCKYIEHGIDEKPFVFIKPDHGTYGMGIMSVSDASDLDHLNRKMRNKMSVIKDGQTVSEVLIQEGVPTCEHVDSAAAEPVVYLVNGEVVGGFYRIHAGRGIDENLNAPGAYFDPWRWNSEPQLPDRLYANGVIARLATLAASHELSTSATKQGLPSCTLELNESWPLAASSSISLSAAYS